MQDGQHLVTSIVNQTLLFQLTKINLFSGQLLKLMMNFKIQQMDGFIFKIFQSIKMSNV